MFLLRYSCSVILGMWPGIASGVVGLNSLQSAFRRTWGFSLHLKLWEGVLLPPNGEEKGHSPISLPGCPQDVGAMRGLIACPIGHFDVSLDPPASWGMSFSAYVLGIRAVWAASES